MRRTPAALLVLALLAGGCSLQGGRFALREDNDVFNLGRGFDTDRDYTQGGEAALTLSAEETPEWSRELARALPLHAGGARIHLAFRLGQEIHTPADIFADPPDPEDRPYAGWLYAGLSLQGILLDPDPVARRDRMDLLSADVGVLGPSSLAEPSQNVTHRVLGIDEAEGWDAQVENEPTLQLGWERRYRVLASDFGGGFGGDLLPGFRARLGTVRVDGSASAIGRLGWRLPRDFGAMTVDGTGLAEGAAPPPPWFALVGSLEGRGSLHDASLDGGLFRSGPSVDRIPLLFESSLGVAAGWGPLQVSWMQHFTSPRFREDRRFHSHTTLLASWAWFF